MAELDRQAIETIEDTKFEFATRSHYANAKLLGVQNATKRTMRDFIKPR